MSATSSSSSLLLSDMDEEKEYDLPFSKEISAKRKQRKKFWYILLFSIISTILLCFHFRCPSTLFVYLVWIICLVPFDLFLFTKEALSRKVSHFGKYTAHQQRSSSQQSSIFKRIRIVFLTLGISIWFWVLVGDQGSNLTMMMQNSIQSSSPTVSLDEELIGKTFIAVNLYNSAKLFPKFGENLIKLVNLIGGKEKAFISIYESNSIDETQHFLDNLSVQLQVHSIQHSIVSGGISGMEETSGSDVKHMYSNPNHIGIEGDGPSRIAFLANVRNEAMKPLQEGQNDNYNKVLWLNDVIFDPKEIKKLLQTNQGLYDVSCAFDYMPLGLYDTWVTRDIDGKRAKPLWPYFNSERDVQSLLSNKPILVDSCWNGAVAFDARWFTQQTVPQTRPGNLSSSPHQEPKRYAIKRDSNGDQISLPLRFRESKKCLSSECLLISLDIHHALQESNKRPIILMNPNVVTAYDNPTFFLYNDLMRWRIVQPWRLFWERFLSAYVFRTLTDVGRKPAGCFEAFKEFWSKPHPLADSADNNSEILEDVFKHRWQ